jgi:hypothetical protein
MKKLMIFAVAAIALVACSKEFDTNKSASNGTAIGFGTWAEQLTKAEARVQGSSTFLNGDTFNVYGFKTIASNTTVFNGDVVAFNGTDWTYSPLRFWDPNASSYTFYAVSPSGKVASANAQSGEFTSNSITFNGNNNDVLVADKKVVNKTGSPAAFATTPVPMVFNHIASLVDFKVKKHADIAAATVAITSFQISNIDNVGTFSINDAYTDTHPVATWNATAHGGVYSNTSGVTSVATLPNNINTDGSDFLINNLVAMPQTFRTDENIQTVTIEYSITSGGDTVEYTSSFNLKLFDKTDDKGNNDILIGGWEAGKHYTFYITINANAIVFTASITDWATPNNGYNYLVQ